MVSGVDPKRTFLTLCDADHLPPEFLWRMKHYRSRGTLAKVNLALSALPSFTGATREMLARPRAAGARSRLPGARLRSREVRALLDRSRGSSSRFRRSTIPRWRRRARTCCRRTRSSRLTRFARADWDASRDALGDTVVKTLSQYAPGLASLIVERQTLTPLDLERGWGLTGGHIFHGELSLDQFFTMRPLLGFGQYRTPIKGLFLCGSGSHPGTGLTGGSGMNAAREVLRSF